MITTTPTEEFASIKDPEMRAKLKSYSEFVRTKLQPDLTDCLQIHEKLLGDLNE
jgi:hypothetical protein